MAGKWYRWWMCPWSTREPVAGEQREQRRRIHEPVQQPVGLSERAERRVVDDDQHRSPIELGASDDRGEGLPLLPAHDAVREPGEVRDPRRLEPDDGIVLAEKPDEGEALLDRDVREVGDEQIPEGLLEAAGAMRARACNGRGCRG